MSVRLRYGGVLYDRTLALQAGVVVPQGVSLEYELVGDITQLFSRVATTDDFDAAEFSLNSHTMMVARGGSKYVGIPVFPSRCFRHSFVFVNRRAGVSQPSDLRGKRVGVEEYAMTAAVWVRALLEHEHGVSPGDLEWFYGGLLAPGHTHRLSFDVPAGVRLEPIPADRHLEEMLRAGDLDALVATDLPRGFTPDDPDIVRLFPDYRAVERSYYERTGFFPIMHTVVVRRSIWEEHPWVARALFDAFVESKRLSDERTRDLNSFGVALPWLNAALEEVDALFGGDAFPYGLEGNRATVDALTTYSFEQGLAARKVEPEELFAL